jgi:hypothetical protein
MAWNYFRLKRAEMYVEFQPWESITPLIEYVYSNGGKISAYTVYRSVRGENATKPFGEAKRTGVLPICLNEEMFLSQT